MKRSDARCVPFDMKQYIAHMIHDLRCNGVQIDGVLPSSPEAIRSWINRLSSDADASLETIPIHQYAGIQQLKACVSKLEGFGAVSNDVRRTRALEKFTSSELACRRANRRALHYMANPQRLRGPLQDIISGIRHRIAVWLSDPMSFEEFSDCSFGPGLTFGMDSLERHVIFKIAGDQTVTLRARQLATEVLTKLFPSWGELLVTGGYTLSHISGNRITFVPKSCEIFRTIAVEPSLNVFLQNGIDQALRRRLRPFGLTLDDQQNSISAMQRGYGDTQGIATIDLSSASDSVAYRVVQWLFPENWFRLFDTVRSPAYTLDKGLNWSIYEKFSSMGNGTTFPIESIIFYAAALECAAHAGGDLRAVRVYGDDIVTQPNSALLLMEVLALFGFKTNREKTFVHGRFRECCGTDILDGIDVRPVFLRKVPKLPDQMAGLHNRLASSRFGFAFGSTLRYLVSLVDKPLFGPSYIGSGQKTYVHPRGGKLSVDEWYAGKCQLPDAYFFGAAGTSKSCRSEWWHSSLVKLELWVRGKDYSHKSFARLTPIERYSGFLYGLGQRIYRPSNRLCLASQPFSGFWPQPSPHQAVYDAMPDTLPDHFRSAA